MYLILSKDVLVHLIIAQQRFLVSDAHSDDAPDEIDAFELHLLLFTDMSNEHVSASSVARARWFDNWLNDFSRSLDNLICHLLVLVVKIRMLDFFSELS